MHWQRLCHYMLTRKLIICLRQVDKIKTKAPTLDGTLDVLLEHLQVQLKMKVTRYKGTFMKYDTINVKVHIDYALVILKENVKEIFRASKQIEQPLPHTPEGIVTITITIAEADNNTVRVPVREITFYPDFN